MKRHINSWAQMNDLERNVYCIFPRCWECDLRESMYIHTYTQVVHLLHSGPDYIRYVRIYLLWLKVRLQVGCWLSSFKSILLLPSFLGERESTHRERLSPPFLVFFCPTTEFLQLPAWLVGFVGIEVLVGANAVVVVKVVGIGDRVAHGMLTRTEREETERQREAFGKSSVVARTLSLMDVPQTRPRNKCECRATTTNRLTFRRVQSVCGRVAFSVTSPLQDIHHPITHSSRLCTSDSRAANQVIREEHLHHQLPPEPTVYKNCHTFSQTFTY